MSETREEVEHLIRIAVAEGIKVASLGAADVIEEELGGKAARLMYGDYREAYLAGISDAVAVLRRGVAHE